MQDEIIRRLTEAVPAKVSDAERQRLAKRHTRSLEAYDHFLRAQALFLVRGARENAEARAQYRRALEADPGFARAYAGLAMTHAIEHRLQPGVDPRPGLDRAFELAESARLIDPDIAEIHWAIGFVHAQNRRHEQALINLREALARNPADLESRVLLAATLAASGDLAAAAWEAEEIRSLERGFAAARWLDSFPLTSPAHRERLRGLLAKAGV